MLPEPDDWLDDTLLADDPPSTRGWQSRALGMTRTQAILGIPSEGQFAFRIPITAHRALRRYLRSTGESPKAFLIAAIETELRTRGHWDDDDYRDLHGR